MDVHIDFVSEPIPPADAWADNQVTGHAPEDLDLGSMVAEFLRNGGKIQEVAQGVSANQLVGVAAFNLFVPKDATSSQLKARAELNKTVNQRVNARYYAGDPALVKRLGDLLEGQPTRKEILQGLGMSDDRLQRLLRTYFADDKRADPYRKVTHEQRHSLDNPHDAGMADTVRKSLDNGHTIRDTSKMTGYSENTVRRLIEKYGMKVRAKRKSKGLQAS